MSDEERQKMAWVLLAIVLRALPPEELAELADGFFKPEARPLAREVIADAMQLGEAVLNKLAGVDGRPASFHVERPTGRGNHA